MVRDSCGRTGTRRPTVALVVAAAALGGTWAPDGWADEKQACAQASEKAQDLRSQSRYAEAREQLLMCGRDACPQIIRKDCTQWLNEVDAALPSVVVNARDSMGRDVVAVRVTVDGKPFVDHLDGKAVRIDPGVHTFHYEMEGAPPVEEKVVVHEGEKQRNLVVSFQTPGAPAAAPATGPGVEQGAPAAPSAGGGPPVVSYVLAGVGVVALGSFAYFGLTGKSDASDLRSQCAPNCTQSQVDDVKRKLLIADISLGVGVVAIGAAAVLWLTHTGSARASTSAAQAAAIDVKPVPGGGLASFSGHF